MKRLQLHDVAEAVGRSPLTIKRMERQGRIPPAARDKNGWRFYSYADLEQVERVIYPKGSGTRVPQK